MTTYAHPPAVDRAAAGRRRSRWLAQVGWRHVVGVLAVAFSLFPILFVLSAALNPLGTLSSTSLVPTGGVSGENFADLFADTAFGHWFVNSLLIAGLASLVSIFLSSLAAYAFSRMRFAGRRVGLLTLLLIQMFPQFLAIVAIFLIFTTVTDLWPAIGFNTPWGLFLLYMGGALGVNTWLMKGFFDTLPRELDESATMDGASHAQVFFRIMLPLVAPILAVTALLSFIGTINEFMIANVFLTDTESKTLAVGMFGLVAGERNNNFGMFAAGTLLTAVPTVLVFQLLQRYIVSGLTAGAVKG
ncbi:sugar ABC transporter permease [Micromonospora carbonacea]|uniref:Carbohydrate ABC transporter membrane protein 2, CUT1 family n=1 Tax=Micromonospora carbonacea TaxID=47853 RepID=A0A1C5A856_9ACTN|nr:sugar ABC transporter permease [Micromonospora carbonacea]MBB5828842.1 arabinogalactan oligomer/maltooligosaccharide transport system permease protein [Micromonospora carbonacea]QLD23608.1 sugar ABC transporter permease [Micromonospora carbonacea]SCF41412.1 carbohydrate ABC transporter membrane protein 2, CUT1 family [Micromonospora carbonacea]